MRRGFTGMIICESSKRLDMTTTDPLFLKGLRLFNEGEYFEAHDVIEELWLKTPSDDPVRDLYKGVIQAAAALYQFDRGVHSGAKGLRQTAVSYLEKYRPKALGLNVGKLIDDLNAFFGSGDTHLSKGSCHRQPALVLEFEE